MEKPDNISYDQIHEALWAANERNRNDGFILTTSNLSGDQIKARIGEDGKCFVAMDGDRLIGTIAVRFIKKNAWYAKGKVPDAMLASVIPEYQGKGVNSRLLKTLIEYLKAEGYEMMELDTAESNTHVIEINKHFGFKLVGYKANPGGDHYSVIMVKWFGKNPYSDVYCSLRYRLKRMIVRMKFTPDKKKRFGK